MVGLYLKSLLIFMLTQNVLEKSLMIENSFKMEMHFKNRWQAASLFLRYPRTVTLCLSGKSGDMDECK